jgi:hypothetical protein
MAKKLKHGSKQVKIWSYKVDHPLATASEVAKATNTSYGYVYKLFQSIGTPKEVFEAEAETSSSPEPRSYSRGNILDTAKEYVTKDRAADHGDMQDNFQRISDYWNVHLGLIDFIKAEDVGVMMALLKIARVHSNPANPDNYIDSAGYIACSGELMAEE